MAASRCVVVRGLSLSIDEPAGASTGDLAPEELLKDGTGVGQLWEGATHLLCDYLEAQPSWLRDVGSIIELGAGLGVPGMLCASLGASSVTLTDYHPLVIARLQTNVRAHPNIAARCTVEEVAWGSGCGSKRHRLLLGADLAISERAAVLLAETVHARVAQGGVFIYAHHERRAVMRGHDGNICLEPTDSGLDVFVGALRPLHCRELHSRPSAEHGRLRLLAFGQALTLAMLPSWCEAASADGVESSSIYGVACKMQRCT